MFFEKKLMPVEKATAPVAEEGTAPYVPEEKRELESGAKVEGIPVTEPEKVENDPVSEETDKAEA